MRAWFAILAALLMALSGCTSADDDTPETGDDGMDDSMDHSDDSMDHSDDTGEAGGDSGDGGSSGGSGSGGGETGGEDPEPVEDAHVTLEVTVAEGFAPVNVVFNFSAVGFEFEDFIDWTLDVNGDGVPETEGTGGFNIGYEQTFDVGGNYTATFSADDGDQFASVDVNFTVLGEPVIPPKPPIVLEGEVQIFCLTIEGCYSFGAEGCLGWLAGQNGADCFWIEVPAEAIGFPFTTTGPSDVDVDFRDGCDQTSTSVGLVGNDGHDAGTVPAGATCVVMSDYNAGGIITMTIQQ